MNNPNDWSDEFFLSYVNSHCETPRALFCGDHCKRLFRLAGLDEPNVYPESFYAMYADTTKPLIKKARERLKSIKDLDIALASLVPDDRIQPSSPTTLPINVLEILADKSKD